MKLYDKVWMSKTQIATWHWDTTQPDRPVECRQVVCLTIRELREMWRTANPILTDQKNDELFSEYLKINGIEL